MTKSELALKVAKKEGKHLLRTLQTIATGVVTAGPRIAGWGGSFVTCPVEIIICSLYKAAYFR